MREFDIRKVLGDDIGHDVTPELRDIEDVGFVNTAELASAFAGNITYKPNMIGKYIEFLNDKSDNSFIIGHIKRM